MGGAAPIPGTTSSFQAYQPNELDWQKQQWSQAMELAMLNMQAQKMGMDAQKFGLQMSYYQPMVNDIMAKRKMYRGVRDEDPKMLAKYAGMPKGTDRDASLRVLNASLGVGEPTQKAAAGGIMQLRGYATGKKTTKTKKTKKTDTTTDTTKSIAPFNPADPSNELEKRYGVELPTKVVDGKTIIDPTAPVTWTDPRALDAFNYLDNMKAPEEYAQASSMYNGVYSGLGSLTNFTPQQVAAQQVASRDAVALQAVAQQASAQQASAQQAAAERATAAQMAAIANVNAERVNLGKYNVNASQMTRPEDVVAQKLNRYQMTDTAPVTTQDLIAYQMAGPGSWTDEGVQQRYMSPYMQGVIDISKREAERDYLKQANALNAKSISAGAFGGSRQALERAEAQRNYNQLLKDLEVQGMQSAYESGRSQYSQELNLSQQAALANLQAKLSTQSQSSQQALQAMLANQNIDYQTKLQNLQAMLGVQGQEAQMMLNAALANQQVAFGTSQTNAQLAQQAALANQGIGAQGDLANQAAALQAALANQQTQFGVGSLNANLATQAALQNAQLGTQASITNAQLGTQASLANAQNALQASMLNAQLGTQASLQNASLGTQVNLANQDAALKAALANQSANLTAGINNQQAGIAGAQLNLGAYNSQINAAGGLGSLGNDRAALEQQALINKTAAAEAQLKAGQAAYDAIQKNATTLNTGAAVPPASIS